MTQLLMVCTGNICRSAYAHRYLQNRLRSDEVTVLSAGSSINAELTSPEALVRLAGERGVDLTGWSPTPLRKAAVTAADLVLVATRDHRAAVLREAPFALQRTFTMLEFGHLLAGTTPTAGTVRDAARELAARRSTVPTDRVDLEDPFRRGDQAYLTMLDRLDPVLDAVASFVAERSGKVQ